MQHFFRATLLSAVAVSSLCGTSLLDQRLAQAQEAAPAAKPAPEAEPAKDLVNEEAQRLEAELGKFKDTSPEAADAMVKLVDLYYENGRLFGLVRIGRRFAASHPSDERHKAIMVKLIDGLEATSRQQDLMTACRQFISQYPEAPETLDIEGRLTRLLDRMNMPAEAAQAYHAAWKRQPTAASIPFGVAAIRRYQAVNSVPSRLSGAALAEEVFEVAPAGLLAEEIGSLGVQLYRANSEWAKSNIIANKMLKKNLPAKPAMKWLHLRYMGENYVNAGQQANAAEMFKQARAIKDNADLHGRQILAMYYGNATSDVIAPLMAEYIQKYPTSDQRYYLQSFLAQAYIREAKKAEALALLRILLPFDAVSHGQAGVFVSMNGTEPAQLADTEKVLIDAIAKNTAHAAILRYTLAFSVYRDQMKDEAKARQVLRDLISKSPEDGTYSQQAVSYLLSGAPNDAEFNADVAMINKAREDNLALGAFRTRLGEWMTAAAEQAKNSKDAALKARTEFVKAELAKTKNDFLENWGKVGVAMNGPGSQFRMSVIESPLFDKLPPYFVQQLLYHEAMWLRHYAPANVRGQAVTMWARYATKFPQDAGAVYGWLEAAWQAGVAEQSHEAVRHALAQTVPSQDTTTWYYLLLSADRTLSKTEDTPDVQTANAAKNKALLLQVIAYLNKAQEIAGLSYERASQAGDLLEKYGETAAALAYWKSHAVPADFFTGEHAEAATCSLRVAARLAPAEKVAYLRSLMALGSYYYGTYAQALAAHYLAAGDLANFEKVFAEVVPFQTSRALLGQGFDEATLNVFTTSFGVTMENMREVSDAEKLRVYAAVSSLRFYHASALAELKLLAASPAAAISPIQRLLRYSRAALMSGNAQHYWDQLLPFANDLLAAKDYEASAALVTGMLANITNNDDGRRQRGREIVAQSYSRMGAVGLTIDEKSPIAPLLQAALMFRLGDRRLAFETYIANQAMFDAHRDEMPVDFLLFICESHSAAGGKENFSRVEGILRGWLVKFSESMQFDDPTKAQVQLLLAKNYFRAETYDSARSEYTTVKNRYPSSAEALEADFGIGETFMAQKIYDQAEAVFDKLSESQKSDVAVRALFLRGVLAHRKGEPEEARAIFRSVLERVPNIDLANQTLYSLSTVYEDEERYMDQLQLLNTVGRLGRQSKRWHRPGDDLSIVVQDNDLGISRGNGKIPVIITTVPGGDQETIYLTSGGGGKGLFRADLRTRLGKVAKGDNILQLTGNDEIKCDYTDEFKSDFKHVPLSDVDIRIASDAIFEVASSLIVDKEKISFTDQLALDEEQEVDQRVSQSRPLNQVKPGNQVFIQVKDPDRDLSDELDKLTVKLAAQSGDEVQVTLSETGDHSGIFTGVATTGELPAGAIATDAAIQHSPLMAIDRDLESYWLSEPDGAAPKELTVDMKDLRLVSRVRISTPNPTSQAPVRGALMGSNDGRFWFRLATNPAEPLVAPVAGEFAQMRLRVYPGDAVGFTTWEQVVNLTKNAKPISDEEVNEISWSLDKDNENGDKPYAAVWHGKFVQERGAAMRIGLHGQNSALVIDGRVELPLGPGDRSVDVYLESGTHDITIFSATRTAHLGLGAQRAHANLKASQVVLMPFKEEELSLKQPVAKINAAESASSAAPQVLVADGDWEFRFAPVDLRFVRLVVNEYVGDAVAISNVEVRGEEDDQIYIPTEDDVLSLSTNETLEMAGGDVVTATYTDDRTQLHDGAAKLLTQNMTATYFDASIATIAYDFIENNNGTVTTVAKDLMRVDAGERFVVEITDYDRDQSDSPDTLKFQVIINDGEPMELTATETEPFSGLFTKEVDTSAKDESGKLTVKPGDRIYCRYIDTQNTFPGHSVPRESVLYVRQPTEGAIRILETRYTPGNDELEVAPKVSIYPPAEGTDVTGVAFEVPLTVEVIDRDAAKDSRSTIDVKLVTSDGAEVEVTCKVSDAFRSTTASYSQITYNYATQQQAMLSALDEGRFVGQVILQLGGKNSPDIVPLSADMPRNLIGGGKLPEEQQKGSGETLVTRVLNVTGKDTLTAVYNDSLRPGGAKELDSKGRLITTGVLQATDREYLKDVTRLHVGEKLFLMISDADQDTTDERDTVEIEISSEFGESEKVKLEETLAHSGVFSGSFSLKAAEKPMADNLTVENAFIETYFGDSVKVKYVDKTASTESGTQDLYLELPVVVGTDGLLSAFSKSFNNETLAVETKFHIAESYFELFKSHKALNRTEEQKADLEAGRRILREVVEDYPDPKYVPRIAYLLGQFAQELGNWDEAISSYETIVRQFPTDSLAPDAQYKLAQSYEESKDFNKALEAYVTLAATYPKSPLIANVMIRISDYFYNEKNYEIAAQVGEKFLERFDTHEYASRIAFRVGQSYYKGKLYTKASNAFDLFNKRFPDDALTADALFWAGESFRMGNSAAEAFRRYNRCRWEFPASEAAKYARGRLTLPEMLQQFEQEAASLENE